MTDPGQPKKSSEPSNTTGLRNRGKLDSLTGSAHDFFSLIQIQEVRWKMPSSRIQPIPAKALT